MTGNWQHEPITTRHMGMLRFPYFGMGCGRSPSRHAEERSIFLDDSKSAFRKESSVTDYFIYIMSNVSRTLYIGMSNNLEQRVWEHLQKIHPGFMNRYNCTMLLYCESFADPGSAIAREKELKGWLRSRKIALIEAENPDWRDLSHDWYSKEQTRDASFLSMTGRWAAAPHAISGWTAHSG